MRSYYEVPFKAYLFGRTQTPEEQVRQWVLFELLSTYNVHINDLDIEHPVRVGTRNHRADILVYRSHSPFIIIECKSPEETSINKALQQAQSYADILNTRYAAATNGSIWVVTRKTRGCWEQVLDLPRNLEPSGQMSLASFLVFQEHIQPLFYWLHRPIPTEYVNQFLKKLQEFFYLSHPIRLDSNSRLLSGIELLLRVLIHDLNKVDTYISEKTNVACEMFLEYFHEVSHDTFDEIILSLKMPRSSLDEILITLLINLDQITMKNKGIQSQDIHLVRIANIIVRYAQDVQSKGKYIDLPVSLMQELQDFINPYCQVIFGVELTDRLEDNTEIRSIVSKYWIDI